MENQRFRGDDLLPTWLSPVGETIDRVDLLLDEASYLPQDTARYKLMDALYLITSLPARLKREAWGGDKSLFYLQDVLLKASIDPKAHGALVNKVLTEELEGLIVGVSKAQRILGSHPSLESDAPPPLVILPSAKKHQREGGFDDADIVHAVKHPRILARGSQEWARKRDLDYGVTARGDFLIVGVNESQEVFHAEPLRIAHVKNEP